MSFRSDEFREILVTTAIKDLKNSKRQLKIWKTLRPVLLLLFFLLDLKIFLFFKSEMLINSIESFKR